MKRRPSKHLREPRPLRFGSQTKATTSEGTWVIRRISGQSSTKTYTCPHCNRPIPPGTPHVVAWPHTPPIGSSSGVEHRRHFHTTCWNARSHGSAHY
nr:hypothetical protein [Propionibacterium sp. oral taxon 192]